MPACSCSPSASREVPGLKIEVVLNGWPKDENVFDGADAVVFYMDGGAKHEVVQEGGRRLDLIDDWAKKGVGIGCMHYGVEVVADQAGEEFKRWIGGHYEHMFSCNPMWEPKFAKFPEHPITRGVKPFAIKDEWYFNMRFVDGLDAATSASEPDGLKFTPILVAAPSDEVRDGPYVYPEGPVPAHSGRQGTRRGDDVGGRAPRRRPRLRLHRRALPRQLGQRQLPQDGAERLRLAGQGRGARQRRGVEGNAGRSGREPRSQTGAESEGQIGTESFFPTDFTLAAFKSETRV